jgi:antibiotic biosynthesis monooxygenase (ABM) superfamily enzyme
VSPSIPITTDVPIELRGKRASSVILHRVPPERVDEFMNWERGITRAAESFAGYQSTDIYPPDDPRKREWIVVIHFDDTQNLKRWTDSPERIEWSGKLGTGMRDFRMKTLPNGFASWFAGMVEGGPAPWQMALTVVLGLYPTVMLLNIFIGQHLSPLGLAASMLVGNLLSVSILQWVVMPPLQRALRPWFQADGPKKTATLIVGAAIIAALLMGMVVLFRRVTG